MSSDPLLPRIWGEKHLEGNKKSSLFPNKKAAENFIKQSKGLSKLNLSIEEV